MSKNCPSCQGKGWVGLINQGKRSYKLICRRCYGKKKLDWIEMILGIDFKINPMIPATHLQDYHPDNYIIQTMDMSCYINEEFFNLDLDIQDRYKHFTMHVHSNNREH